MKLLIQFAESFFQNLPALFVLAGTKLLQDAYPLWRKAQEEAARRMGHEGLAALKTLTKKLGG